MTQAQGGQWSRPTGRVSLEAVVAEPEKNDPLSGVLIWAQPSALLAAAQKSGGGGSGGSGGSGGNSINSSGSGGSASVNSTPQGVQGGWGLWGWGGVKETKGAVEVVEVVGGLEVTEGTLVLADAVGSAEVPGFPYARRLGELQEQAVAPATHAVYAFTWLSLATAGVFMTLSMFKKAPRRR
ncbi:hypothetical protein B484DRAFT_396809 [Ochromonadaceae sp. CCMP2298]|nr:hypothetical protein B484DRAFT_396809 [Ochromonadaceae sp. CCMP2298]